MKKIFLALLLISLLGAACSKSSKNKTPQEDTSRVVTTLAATDVETQTATLNGTVFWEEGKAAPTEVYFLLIDKDHVDRGDAQFPSVQQMLDAEAESIAVPGSFVGAGEDHPFSAGVTDLKGGTLYFFCAAASFGTDVIYGGVKKFNTNSTGISNLAASNITPTSMTVSFSYEDDDVSKVDLLYEDFEGFSDGHVTDYSKEDHVYSFNILQLTPYTGYRITPRVFTGSGATVTDILKATTLKGIILFYVNTSSNKAEICYRMWHYADVPTLYYTTDPYLISGEYTSAPHMTMYRIYEPGQENYGRDFKVDILNLPPNTKYYILATQGNLRSEISSFTTSAE